MLEKLLLAAILTFALSLIAEMGWSSPNRTSSETHVYKPGILSVTQFYQ
ncbi:hypothetical protein H6G76_32775 [Nostoc sp. FACHB-152]|nr:MULTISPECIES: hypothetical protein [unclassified Nostoc]MBD2451812.1 hypothetical protein [Nostoc sp. FACHB-152]MBD2472896.1 hypothetical protein [Nostoc sp. FACHB-145]